VPNNRSERRLRVRSLVGFSASAALAMIAVLVGPTRRLFWSDLGVSCLIALGVYASRNAAVLNP
jgi:hypothetical protein